MNTTVFATRENASGENARMRLRGVKLLLTLAAIAVGAIVLPASANAFNIANFKITPSTTQAGSHPNVNFVFERQGSESEDVKDIALDLPIGMFQNPENANPKCTDTQFNADTCPNNSVIGKMTVSVTAAGLLNMDAPGSIYMLTPRPNETATLGMVVRPAPVCILFVLCIGSPKKMFLKTGVTLKAFGDQDGLRTRTINSPATTTIGIPLVIFTANLPIEITIKKFNLTFNGRTGASNNLKYSMVASTSCQPSVAKATLVSNTNVSSSMTASYAPTGCASVPFNPTISVNPTSKVANAMTPLTFSMFVPQADATIQNAHPKIVDVDLPNGSGIELNQLAGVNGCTETQLRNDACPADSIIGNATSNAPYLPPMLTGTIYAMNPVTNQVPVGVVLRGARGTLIIFRGVMGVRGDPSAGTGRVYSRFDIIPQLPYADVVLNITKNLYKNPNPATCGTQTTSANITGFHGGTVNRTASYTLTGCSTPPTTTITNGPPSPGSDSTPTFTFTSNFPNNSFVCKIDSLPSVPCNGNNSSTATTTTGSYTTEPLSEATHTFTVQAINGVTPGSSATRTFVIQTSFDIAPTLTSTTTGAGLHPNLVADAAISGGQPKDIQIRFPAGFAASLAARPLCSVADAAAGNCASASQIGTMTITANTGQGSVTGVGPVYLTAAPTGADAGGAAVEVPMGTLGTLIAQAGAYLVENGRYQYLDLRNIPQVVGTTQINITHVNASFDGSTNRFLTNASSCNAGAFVFDGTSYAGERAGADSIAYTATGCSATNPPFNPSVNQTILNPVASTSTTDSFSGVIADVTLPIDNATIKRMEVREPAALSPNYSSFGAQTDQCRPGSIVDTDPTTAVLWTFTYSASNCPAQARIGSMTITTPLLPTPIVGDVYLVNRSPIPWLGVAFDDPGIQLTLAGVTSLPETGCDITIYGYCPPQITVTFDNVPDTPISSVRFALDGPDRVSPTTGVLSGKVLQIATADDPVCLPNAPAQATITSYSTANALRTQNIAISGCNTP